MAAHGNDARLVPLADDNQRSRIEVNILEVCASEFRKTKAGGIEKLQNRMITKFQIRHRLNRNQLRSLFDIQRVGQFALTARCRDPIEGIDLGLLLPEQIPITGSCG